MKTALFVIPILIFFYIVCIDGKRFLVKKNHEAIHKFFPDEDDYLDSWDSLRSYRHPPPFDRPVVPFASETHQRPIANPDPQPLPTPGVSTNQEQKSTTPILQASTTKEEVRLDAGVESVSGNKNDVKAEADWLDSYKTDTVKDITHDCDKHYCPVGRICELDSEGKPMCVCAGPDHCLRHRRHGLHQAGHRAPGRRVCGTDGIEYPSHCEMHRQACVQEKHIRASKDDKLCTEKQKTEDEVESKIIDEQHLPKPKNSHHKFKDLTVTHRMRVDDDDDDDDDKVLDEQRVRYFRTSVVQGSGLEIRCDDSVAETRGRTVWRRNGALVADLLTNDIQVFADGSLYFTRVEPFHIGSYSCERSRALGLTEGPPTQIHVLSVIVAPEVQVSPSVQQHMPGVTVSVRCHSSSLPDAQISWRIDDKPVTSTDTNRFILDGGHMIQIQNIDQSLNGSNITCVVENPAGIKEASSRLIVKGPDHRYSQVDSSEEEYYVVFHADGYTVYEPNYCHIMHVVSGNYLMSKDSQSYFSSSNMCGSKNGNNSCEWGHSVHVGVGLVYVAQPTLNRILAIELTDRFNPIEVIDLQCSPRDLTYLQHTDQLWITCKQNSDDVSTYESRDVTSYMTSVIRHASSATHHQIVHIQPLSGVADDFTMIHRTFLPDSHTDGIKVTLNYGYASLGHDDKALYKIDLIQLKFVKRIETPCKPLSVAFLLIGGHVVVSCDHESAVQSFVLDYITDAIPQRNPGVEDGSNWMNLDFNGKLYMSPDSKQLSVVNGRKLTAYNILENGDVSLINSYQIDKLKDVADVQFTLSPRSGKHSPGFNLFLRDTNQRLVYLDLNQHLIHTIDGIEEILKNRDSAALNRHSAGVVGHLMTSAETFSDHVVTVVSDSVVVVDSQRHQTQCQWPGLTPISSVVGVRKE